MDKILFSFTSNMLILFSDRGSGEQSVCSGSRWGRRWTGVAVSGWYRRSWWDLLL